MDSERASRATIHLDALCSNYEYLRSLAPRSKMLAVVKANAYGHGLEECALALQSAGVDAFGVAIGEEGLRLRKLQVSKPIVVFGGVLPEQLEPFVQAKLELTGSSVEKVRTIAATARSLNIKARVHLKIDTGMGRIGVRPENAKKLFETTFALPEIEVAGVYTHFADADGETNHFTRQQLASFEEVRPQFYSVFGDKHPALFHAANSAALLRYPETHLDMVRPGIALYGVPPPQTFAKTLQPVMSVHSKISYFKVVKKGSSVSYGRTWTAEKDVRVVTVPIGYGDGYPRILSNRSFVLIRGKRYPVVGTVCMDQLMVCIGNEEAYVGDHVTLLGHDDSEKISAEDLARWAQTIPYEILIQINSRIPRFFKDKCV